MSRTPRPIGRGHVSERIDRGTLVLVRSPLPGPIGKSLSALSIFARVAITLEYTVNLLPAQLRDQGQALLTGKTIAATTAMIAISVGSQFTPFGWTVDLAMFGLGAAALGASVIQVGADLCAFASETASADSDDGLHSAARHLARAITVIGVGTLLIWLTKRGANIALSTSELLVVARGVVLNVADREVALWSGVKPLEHIPRQFASLERMLDETPAGRELLKTLRQFADRNEYNKVESVWQELSERIAALATESKRPVHYFVSADRGYYEALHPSKSALSEWWAAYRPELLRGIRRRLADAKAAQADIERQVMAEEQRLSRWTQEDIEAQYYAEQRHSRYYPNKIEDEVFHKLEKLHLRGAWVHELNSNGVEIRKWWQEF